MAKRTNRPGDKRRRKGKKRADPKRPRFVRPIEWAQQEFIGVKAWLTILKGPDGEVYPVGWRAGMIRHYEKRARMLRAEIKASRLAEAASEDEGDNGTNVA